MNHDLKGKMTFIDILNFFYVLCYQRSITIYPSCPLSITVFSFCPPLRLIKGSKDGSPWKVQRSVPPPRVSYRQNDSTSLSQISIHDSSTDLKNSVLLSVLLWFVTSPRSLNVFPVLFINLLMIWCIYIYVSPFVDNS